MSASSADTRTGFWARVREHKIIQWGLAYLGAALAIAHGGELLSHSYYWPEVIGRLLMGALIVGFPVALVFAWYHGHRGLKRVAAGELGIISVLLLIGAVFFTVSLRPSDEHAAEAAVPADITDSPAASSVPVPAGEPAASLVLPNSIAVLPFDNLSPDPNNAFFAAGIHDEVLNQLGKLKSLNVIARTSVMQYANAARPITEIARELNVETVMEGSVSYAEGRVAVRAQLIDANTGVHLWSDSYDREFADVFGIQADIAMNIANALDATFSDEEQENLERIPTTSPEAYALYLRAWAAWGSDRGAVERYLDRAIELDPNFAQAYERKAGNYSQMMIRTFGSPTPELDPAELYQLVQEHANKALDLDPSLGGAYGALGTAHRNYWHWTEAKRAFDRGREADPSFLGDAWFYAYFGEPALAVRSAERFVTLSPQDPFAHYYLGSTYLYLQRTDESIIALQNAVSLEPVVARYHFVLAQAYTQNGNAAEALQELRISRELFDDVLPFVADFAYIYARLGRDDEATNLVNEFEANLVPTQGTEDSAMRIKAALAKGDEAEALRWLRIAVAKVQNHEPDVGFYSLMTIKHNFLADPVLEQPEFVVLRHELAGD